MTKIGMRRGGRAPGIFILTITGIYSVLMIPASNFNRGHSNEKKIDQNREPPLFWSIWPPPALFCARPLYPQEVLKVPVGVNNHLLAPVMIWAIPL